MNNEERRYKEDVYEDFLDMVKHRSDPEVVPTHHK